MSKLYPPWSNGTQFMDWQSRNCFRCQHYIEDEPEACPVSDTIDAALIEHRPWTEADSSAVGYEEAKNPYTWDCPSRLLEGESFPGDAEDCEGQLRIELACCTSVLLDEIADKRFKQADIAKTYRLAMASSDATDWAAVNSAIIARWSKSGLVRIKEMAHKPPADSAESIVAEQTKKAEAESKAYLAELIEKYAQAMAEEGASL